MSRHEPRQQLARQFGATGIIAERGDGGVAVIKELTDGYGLPREKHLVSPAAALSSYPGCAGRR